jgi:hypothetical protein
MEKVELEKVTIEFFDAGFDKQAWVSGCLLNDCMDQSYKI